MNCKKEEIDRNYTQDEIGSEIIIIYAYTGVFVMNHA